MVWKIIAASVKGSGHVDDGSPCQDACDYVPLGEVFLAVLCDGAGSYKHSRQGALHGVTVVHILERRLRLSRGIELATEEAFRALIIDAIKEVRSMLLDDATKLSSTLFDFHATMLGCLYSPLKGGFFFHIGDGIGLALEAETHGVRAVSRPENGEFAEQTFFYTENHWCSHLRITPIPVGADLIVLMSDGPMAFAVRPSLNEVDSGFLPPVTRYLSQTDVLAENGIQALAETLSSPGACEVTKDDKTLVWGRWII